MKFGSEEVNKEVFKRSRYDQENMNLWRENDMSQVLTGKPSVDKPWMQYYPEQLIKNLKVPSSTIGEYLQSDQSGR